MGNHAIAVRQAADLFVTVSRSTIESADFNSTARGDNRLWGTHYVAVNQYSREIAA